MKVGRTRNGFRVVVDFVFRTAEHSFVSLCLDPSTNLITGNLWTFNFFFFNKNLKRILYFTCIATSKYNPEVP